MSEVLEIGNKYGRLTCLKYLHTTKRGFPMYECKCDCGQVTTVDIYTIRSGQTKSCGCLRKENASKLFTKHGHAKQGKQHPVYLAWQDMKKRCYYKKCIGYKNYGARGIKVCPQWKDNYPAFYKWAINNGYQKGLTIERIDVNGNYEPSNCTWVPFSLQSRNKRTNKKYKYKGQSKLLVEWSEIVGINSKILRNRIEVYG